MMGENWEDLDGGEGEGRGGREGNWMEEEETAEEKGHGLNDTPLESSPSCLVSVCQCVCVRVSERHKTTH